MNSKLRNILQSWLDNAMTTSSFGWSPIDGYKGHEENSEKEAAKDYEKYLAKAEKAIRQAVGEELMELLGEIEPEEIRNVPKNKPINYPALEMKLIKIRIKNDYRAELRQKIKEWAALKEPSNEA